MFKLIAADLREFASSVKDDTITAVNIVKQDAISKLDRLDETMGLPVPSEAEREAKFRTSIREVYSTALPVSQKSSTEDVTADPATTSIDKQISAFEAKEVTAFLDTFDIIEKTDEISKLLQTDEKLRTIFEDMVPIEVTYEEFWRRHYYRCDADRIQRAWDLYTALGGGNEANALSKLSGVISAPVRLALRPFSAARKVTGNSQDPTLKPEETTSPDKLLRDAQSDIAMMQSALSSSNKRIASLRLTVDELNDELRTTRENQAELNIQVALLKKQLQQKNDVIQNFEDQLLSNLGDSPLPSLEVIKTSWHHPDASGQTQSTASSTTSESSSDQHIGTCVTLPAAKASNSDHSVKRSSTLWKLATFGAWGGNDTDGSNANDEDCLLDNS